VEVEGKWGEGPVSLRGTVGLGPEFRPVTVDLSFEGHNLRFRVPDVAHGTFDATLTARGKIPGPLIQGEVVLRRATYTKEVRPAVVQGNQALTQTVARIPESLRGLRFEVQFRSPGDLWIRNNVANLEIRANLTLRGTAEAPIVLGHAELVQGSWIYRDRPFQLVSGSFDFLTPRRINPQISVTAESRVREVKLLLTVTGTLDNLAFQLGSDPPLPREQINNLVATGAAGLVGGDILGPLLGEAGKIAKLDVFQVEPSLDARQKASVAMGKRFGDRLEVTLTRTIGSGPGQRVLVEYQIFDFLSLVATQNERGITGLDLRFSYPFR
jgi:autotransporter translocation and assembly factor TamB